MRSKRPFPDGLVLAVHTLGVFVAPLALLLMPPARGAMLLLPVAGVDAIRFARDHDATLLRPGPLPGSVVVLGDRASLASAPWRIVALSAAAVGCGPIGPRA